MQSRLMKNGQQMIRILDETDEQVFIVDCIKVSMPRWIDISQLDGFVDCEEDELLKISGKRLKSEEDMNVNERKMVHTRYTLIAGILPFLSDNAMRNRIIRKIITEQDVSKNTVRSYLYQYITSLRMEKI